MKGSSREEQPAFFTPKDGEFYKLNIIPLETGKQGGIGPNGGLLFICPRKMLGKSCPICEEYEMYNLRKEKTKLGEI
jgi:hypothetical protein